MMGGKRTDIFLHRKGRNMAARIASFKSLNNLQSEGTLLVCAVFLTGGRVENLAHGLVN